MSSRVEKIEFTPEMKETHTILFPNMITIHFQLLKNILSSFGYKAELLKNTSVTVVEEGLRYVHNDTCYPALLTIGQMIDALKRGGYDTDHVALAITQTGGGCRASNYIFLLRKALRDAGFNNIPVISLNLSGMEKNSGFKITVSMIGRMISAMTYGDMLMLLSNQTRPYEIIKGSSDKLVDRWVDDLSYQFAHGNGYQLSQIEDNLQRIVEDFDRIDLQTTKKIKVGIVGEIYAKYSPLANNHLEEFLHGQDCEVMVPGIMQFLLYAVDMPSQDILMYGGNPIKQKIYKALSSYLTLYENMLLKALQNHKYTIPSSYQHLKEIVKPFISTGCKMGEGFLLTAEMVELTTNGYENIVCAQPFGCLPNHIVGKAMMHKIRKVYPYSNIVAIDYDASAAKVNQENRIKLMLSIAKENMEAKAETKEDPNPKDLVYNQELRSAHS